MIKSLKALSGFAANLPALKDRTFEFTPGLNILFGQNGSGKSTVIRIAGAYSGTTAGWSKYYRPDIALGDEKKAGYPERMAKESPGGCKAAVDWDGSPSFLMSPETGNAPGSSLDDSPDGLMDMGMIVSEMMAKLSSGQSRMVRFNKFLKMASDDKSIPDLTKLPDDYKNVNDTWQEAMKSFVDYVKSLPRKGPITLLLDEVDRSLSIPNQITLWTKVLPAIGKKDQVIVATHSDYALIHEKEIIELNPGYVAECQKAIKEIRK